MGVCSSKSDLPPPKEAPQTSTKSTSSAEKSDNDNKVSNNHTTKVNVITTSNSTSSTFSSSTSGTASSASNPGVAQALRDAPSYDYEPKDGETPFALSVQYFPEDVDETQEITLPGVYAKMTILQLKLLIYKQGPIKDLTQKMSNFHPVNSVRLIYERQPMLDDNSLSDYGIESSGSSISFIAN